MATTSDIIQAFRAQAEACKKLGSPFMTSLLVCAARELECRGSIAGLLAGWPGNPQADAVPLRLAAALHALALSGTDRNLGTLYTAAGAGADDALWSAARAAIVAHRDRVEQFLGSPPQINEVGRSAVLLGGFLTVADVTRGLPMRLLEIGASAGLNLLWDQYRYKLGGRAEWGEPDSPVRITADWTGAPPPLQAHIQVATRAASDVAPIDLNDPEARLRLRAYIWADAPTRMALLDAAIALVRQHHPYIEKSDAADWVSRQLDQTRPGHVTVLYHSVAWPYFPAETQQAIREALEAAGRRASADAPLAWLRLEPPEDSAPDGEQLELQLTMWPGRTRQCLARAHTHGSPISWLAETSQAKARRDDQIHILNRETLSENWYQLERVTFDYPRRDGSHQTLQREVYHNGPGAGVLPFDPDRGTVLLVRQFRVAAALNADPGRLIEACAGNIEDGDDPAETVRKEAEQELGYRLRELHKVFALYMSPGATAEKLHLFVGAYSPADRIGPGGGERAEGEETEILELRLPKAWDMVQSGEIVDAKTVLLLQHLRATYPAQSGAGGADSHQQKP